MGDTDYPELPEDLDLYFDAVFGEGEGTVTVFVTTTGEADPGRLDRKGAEYSFLWPAEREGLMQLAAASCRDGAHTVQVLGDSYLDADSGPERWSVTQRVGDGCFDTFGELTALVRPLGGFLVNVDGLHSFDVIVPLSRGVDPQTYRSLCRGLRRLLGGTSGCSRAGLLAIPGAYVAGVDQGRRRRVMLATVPSGLRQDPSALASKLGLDAKTSTERVVTPLQSPSRKARGPLADQAPAPDMQRVEQRDGVRRRRAAGPVVPPVDGLGVLQAALMYASSGMYVLPVKRGTKNPGSVVGSGWQTKSSRDPKILARWFRGTDHGIAIHAGRSGLVVFDVDHPEHLPQVLRDAIEQTDPPFQQTRPGTRRGHFVFLQPPELQLGNGLGTLPKGWGQVRGDNGVIMVQPSFHPEGGHYRWEKIGTVPRLPAALAAALTDTPRTSAVRPHRPRQFDSLANPSVFRRVIGPTGREAMCRCMREAFERTLKELANGCRHEAILGNLLRLSQLAREGHSGIGIALDDIRVDFVARVTAGRGSETAATEEFWRAASSAIAEVLGSSPAFPYHRACDCLLTDLTLAINNHPQMFTRGSSGLIERDVMRYLTDRARQGRRRVVNESQRQIALAICSAQPTVGDALARLEDLGWIRRHVTSSPWKGTPVRLLLPGVCTDVSTKKKEPTADSLVDISTHMSHHYLFSVKGLGRGCGETLAALPETGSTVRRTARDLETMTGAHRTTIRRRLRRLLEWHLAVEVDGCWYRVPFDADAVAAEHEVVDPQPAKTDTYRRQRLAHHKALERTNYGVGAAPGPDGPVYVDNDGVVMGPAELEP